MKTCSHITVCCACLISPRQGNNCTWSDVRIGRCFGCASCSATCLLHLDSCSTKVRLSTSRCQQNYLILVCCFACRVTPAEAKSELSAKNPSQSGDAQQGQKIVDGVGTQAANNLLTWTDISVDVVVGNACGSNKQRRPVLRGVSGYARCVVFCEAWHDYDYCGFSDMLPVLFCLLMAF